MRYLLDRLSYHAVYDASIIEALTYAKANGFSGAQLALDVPQLSFEAASPADAAAIRQVCERERLRVVLHLPDDSSFVEVSRLRFQGTLNYCAAMFSWAQRIGCRLITFHVGKPATFKMGDGSLDVRPEQLLAAAEAALAENLSRLIELAQKRFTLCFETWAMTPAVMEILQPHLDCGRLAVCWDLPKRLDPSGRLLPQYETFLARNASRIRQLHLHDRRDGRNHRVIGSGDIDFRGLSAQVNPPHVEDCCIEVRPRERACASLRNLHLMLRE